MKQNKICFHRPKPIWEFSIKQEKHCRLEERTENSKNGTGKNSLSI